ncbi:MAG: hypothetical protein AB2A00_27700 [Myxococcota bacterium]
MQTPETGVLRCCRSTLLPASLIAVVLAGCGGTSDPPGATSSTSSSSGSSGQTSSSSGSTSSSSSGGTCEPVTCEMACRYGFASGPDGCLICQCLPDPRHCDDLTREECSANPECAVVTFSDGDFRCCNRDDDGIHCSEPPPPPVCISDSECSPGQICNTWDYCEPMPGCDSGDCPAVCYGRCVAGTTNGECASDYDCAFHERCAFSSEPVACPEDPNSGACAERYLGECVVIECAQPICPDGSEPQGYEQIPHSCPIPICGGGCEGLSPEMCEARRDCRAIYEAPPCDCACEPNEACECACPSAGFRCEPRPTCFSDLDCLPSEYCEFAYSPCPECDMVAMGICVERVERCEGLDEDTCRMTPGCIPSYGEICPACPADEPGSCPPCTQGFMGCKPDQVIHCSRDLDCGPGYRCNTCPPDPTCPECDVCGPPVCEPNPVTRCTDNVECGPGAYCRFEVCTDSYPPSCVGVCEPLVMGCEGLDEGTCASAPGCQPVYQGGNCNDGCHDDQGRLTSCGPCLAVACDYGEFAYCETAQFDACCNSEQCPTGQSCQFIRDQNLGECLPDETSCGEGRYGACPAGSECQVVGCAASCGGTPGDPGTEPGCCPDYQCVPVAGCTSDEQCGPGMFCNACPPDPTCPMCDVCGPSRCESLEPGTCRTQEDCPMGCACEGPMPTEGQPFTGSCLGPDGQVCQERPFRVCENDAQCLPDEYCQRCPPGAACFVEDHCAPRERPYRLCNSDAECLADEHCGTSCDPAICDEAPHCMPGAPTLRECASDLECRPDEYCFKCPPNALCDTPDHCEPRGFRTCSSDAECLPDEYCQMCPPGAACFVADHCERREWRECSGDADCLADEHCEMCPPGAACLVADHCVKD